ncbi:hypothetical protein [Parabacteroides sp. FAFU027]|uniref:hypothetical protein n=1 Tax=Parabacteroides sp. FAFU027 TaxID=2922715 RepID=UPI001FB019F3|nr:hypothetical protein [Parabacteroides sp. FAFU027]
MRNKLIVWLVFCSFTIYGQNLKVVENELLKHLTKISYWAHFTGNAKISAEDSLDNENEIFYDKLLNYTSKIPSTLAYDFSELKKAHLIITTSSDKKFRIYSWDTELGGTMKDYESICQYQGDKKVCSKSLNENRQEGDIGCWYSEIFTLETGSKKVYIAYGNAEYSSSGCMQGVQLFSIDNEKLNDKVRLIKTKTGIRNKLYFEFDFFSVANRKERPVKLIYFDENTKTLKIPVVTNKLKVTNQFITYKYNGQFFERVSK